jgi:Flp pilus assembly protein TadD
MKSRKAIAALWALLTFAAASAAGQTAQQGGGRHPGSIRGYVVLSDSRPVTEPVKVTLKLLRGDRNVQYTDTQGNFFIRGLDPGLYTVEIEADRERKYEVASERVEVFPDTTAIVTLYLKEKGAAAKEKPAGETVSAAELDAGVPAGAKKEFEQGVKAGREGKFEEAAAHMRKALEIHPGYLQARNDLGTFLLAQGKLEEAGEELAEAVRLAPRAFNPRLNLGIVLVRRHEFSDAAQQLEVALSVEPGSPAGHLYAGLAQAGLGESARAEKELRTAYELGGSDYALAQFHLGQLYMDRGERALAVKAFETYLRDKPNAPDAEQVKRMIAVLR